MKENKMKTNWLKSLAVASVVSMAAANASADVVGAVTANTNYTWTEYGGPYRVPGMRTASFNHPGGPLVAIFSADCALDSDPVYGPAFVDVEINVQDARDQFVASLSPSGTESPFCSSSGARGFNNRGSFATTGVGTLPPGTYTILVRAQINRGRGTAVLGARSLVVLR